MKNLFAFAFTILCCILVAECQDEFADKMKMKMEELFCGKDKDDQTPFINCVKNTMPAELLEIIKEETGKEKLCMGLKAMCDDDTFKMVNEKIRERADEFEVTEEDLDKLDECIEKTN